jgi:hypothetical protein
MSLNLNYVKIYDSRFISETSIAPRMNQEVLVFPKKPDKF